MSLDDYRRLVDVAAGVGVALEIDDAGRPDPLVLSALGATTATTLRLTLDEGRQLFDALAEALALIAATAGARHAAGRDTPAGSGPLSPPSARV